MNISIKPLFAFVLLAAIFVTALVIRLSPVIQDPEKSRNGFGPYGDTYLYHVLGYNLYKGNGFSGTDNGRAFGSNLYGNKLKYEPAIARGPVYPVFISMVYRFFCSEKDMQSMQEWHKNWDKVRIAQCLLDAIVCIFVFLITKAILEKSYIPALISSLLYCFSFYNIFYTRTLLSESVTTFLLTASLLFCILGLKHEKLYLWGFAGALFGLVILSRPEYLLFPAIFMLYVIFINRTNVLNALKKPLVFIIAAAIVVIPWTIRNYHVFKEFVPVAVSGIGMSLYQGTYEANNNWQSWEDVPNIMFDSKEERASVQSLFRSYYLSSPTGSIERKDIDKSLMNLALKRLHRHPFECLKCWIIKIPRLWYQFYIPMYRDKEASGGFFIFYFIFALWALGEGTPEEVALMAPVCVLFIYLTLIFLPLHIEPRYGVALMPGIICLASVGIWKTFLSALSKSFHIKLFSTILISCLGIIVFSNTFYYSFHLDDVTSISNNPAIKNIHDLQSIWNFWPSRFITNLSIAFNYHFNGLDVSGYHLFNLGIHIVSAILVWWLVLLILSTPAMKENKITQHADLLALFTGLVFVSHPVQTEAVTYIVQRAASISTLFYLTTLCFYLKSSLLQDIGLNPTLRRIYYMGALITAVMAMFTKENAITLPFMILLFEFSFLNAKKNFNWGRVIPFLLTIVIIPLTMLLTKSVNFQGMNRAIEAPSGITSMHYFMTQFRVMVTYVRLLFLPINQNLDYDYPISKSLFGWPTLLSFLFLILVLFSAKRLFLKYRLVSFSIFWFFLTLLPESSIIPIKDVIFEHRLYLPLVGYSLFLVSGLYYLGGKNNIKAMVIILTMVIGCNSVLTYQRNKVWKNEFTLWDDAVRKSPHKARPHYNRGNYYAAQGNFTQALSDYNKALESNSQYAEAYNNRGFSYDSLGNLTQAISDYNKAIELNPRFAEAYNNRGTTFYKQGNMVQALSDYNKAIEINPNYQNPYYNRNLIYKNQSIVTTQAIINPMSAEAYYNQGSAHSNEGRFAEAISDYNKAIELNPKYLEAYSNRGNAYDNQGNMAQAISDYSKAIEINPQSAIPYIDRGVDYFKQGNLDQALSDYNKAIEIDPERADVYNNRANAYFTQGNMTQAISDYNKAIEIDPKYIDAYGNRAIVYYQLKQYNDAWADVHKIEELGHSVNPQLVEALKSASAVR